MLPGEWIFVILIGLVWLIIMGYSLGTVTLPGTSVRRERLWCAAMEREAEVEFLVREGVPYEVNRCSVIADHNIACGKRCLETAARAA